MCHLTGLDVAARPAAKGTLAADTLHLVGVKAPQPMRRRVRQMRDRMGGNGVALPAADTSPQCLGSSPTPPLSCGTPFANLQQDELNLLEDRGGVEPGVDADFRRIYRQLSSRSDCPAV